MRAHQSIEKLPKLLLVALAFVFVEGARLFGTYRWQDGTEELRARLDPSARARAPRAAAAGLAATPVTSPRAAEGSLRGPLQLGSDVGEQPAGLLSPPQPPPLPQ
jgi:hypothetical protein